MLDAVDGDALGGAEFALDSATGIVTLDTPPDLDAVVTAGFLFDTPVRFDVDRLDLALDGFGAGPCARRAADRNSHLMRTIPVELSARLASGVTTLAHVWRVERRDGEVFGFTDHDRALILDGLTCAPSSGFKAAAIEKSLGLSVDTASIAGALSAEAITEEDLARGLWDGARVGHLPCRLSEPSLFVQWRTI